MSVAKKITELKSNQSDKMSFKDPALCNFCLLLIRGKFDEAFIVYKNIVDSGVLTANDMIDMAYECVDMIDDKNERAAMKMKNSNHVLLIDEVTL